MVQAENAVKGMKGVNEKTSSPGGRGWRPGRGKSSSGGERGEWEVCFGFHVYEWEVSEWMRHISIWWINSGHLNPYPGHRGSEHNTCCNQAD